MANAVQERAGTLGAIRTVIRHTAVYGFGNILAKTIGFLMLPLYTHYLSPVDYGILEVLDLSMSLLGMFLMLGLAAALLRSYTSANTEPSRKACVSTAFLFTAATGLLTLGIGFALMPRISALLLGPGPSVKYVQLSFVSFILGYVTTVPRTYLRALEASGTFVTVETASLFVNLSLNVVFIVVFHYGLLGILWSSLIIASLQCLLLSLWMLRRVGIGLDMPALRDMLAFGAPLMFANVGLFLLNFADRFFLQHFRSLEVVGVYAVGYKFGYMLNYLLIQPFFIMWQTRMFIIHQEPNHAEIFRRIGIWYGLVLMYAGFVLSILSPEIIHVMVGPSFTASREVIPVVALSYVFYGLGFYAQLGLFLSGKTSLLGGVGAAAAALNIVANYALIRPFGIMGAAWATAFGFAVLAAGGYWYAQRVYPLPLPTGRIMAALGLCAGAYAAARIVAPADFVPALGIKFLFIAALPAVIWKCGVLGAADRDLVVSLGRELSAKLRWPRVSAAQRTP